MEKAKKIREGDVRTASRLIRNIEDNIPDARATIKDIFHDTGKAHVVGITGSPGAGKSTLVDGIINWYRRKGKTVGVLAVDPTSPFTGGAILGDRIRMQRHADDPGVFVRSLATRGFLGGLSKAVGDAIHILDAMGKDVILVETVGAGQQEVEIINHAHTVIVVLVPGMGDEIQVLKAGIMEIADIFVINKSDRDGTRKLQREVLAMLDMSPSSAGGWKPAILTVGNAFNPAIFEAGIEALSTKIGEHYQDLICNDRTGDRIRRKTMHEMSEALRACILEPVLSRLVTAGEMDCMIGKVIRKEVDPYTLAEEVAIKCLRLTND